MLSLNALLLAMVFMILPFSQSVAHSASGSPTLTVISPSGLTNLYWNTPFRVEFKLEGGWASDLNNCSDLAFENFDFWVAMNYNSDESLILRTAEYSYGSYEWATKLTANGIQCSIGVYSRSQNEDSLFWSSLYLENTSAANYLNLNIHNGRVNNVNGTQTVIIGWVIDNQFYRQDLLAKEAVINLDFIGLTRGDDISYVKNYMARVERPIDAPEVEVGGLTYCDLDSIETLTSTLVSKYMCQAVAAGSPGVRTITLSSNSYVKEYSKSVTVNFIKTGWPVLDVEPRLNLTSNSTYQNEFVEFQVNGNLYLSNSNSDTTSQNIRICINRVNCETVRSEERGSFTYSRILPHKPGTVVQWSIESIYDGVLVEESGEQNFTAISKPVPVKPNPITRVQYLLPKSVKWGRTFTVAITPSGKGSAQCSIWFQATSPVNGRYDFNIYAGKTSKVVIRPTYYQLASWPVSLRCWPANWGDRYFDMSLGRIQLIN